MASDKSNSNHQHLSALRSNPCPCTSNVLGGDGGHVREKSRLMKKHPAEQLGLGLFVGFIVRFHMIS